MYKTNTDDSCSQESDTPSDNSSVQYERMVTELVELLHYRPKFIQKNRRWIPIDPLSPLWLNDKHLDETLSEPFTG